MARIRTIKPGFFKHETLSTLDAETQLLAAGLLCYADDEGYFNANPKLVQAEIFPLRELSRTIPVMLQELSRVGFIRLGNGPEGRTYGHVVNFLDHQVISHAKESEISCLPISWNITGTLPEASILNGIELNGTELNRSVASSSKKRTRRSKQQILEPYPEEVGTLVNHISSVWPEIQPADKTPITIDTPKLAERIDALLREPNITSAVLMHATEMYLSEQKQYYKYPQFFFGQPNGESAHWATYARMSIHQASKELTH